HHGAHAAVIVDQPVTVGVEEIRPLAALKHQRPRLHALAEVAVHPTRDPSAAFGDARRRCVEAQLCARARTGAPIAQSRLPREPVPSKAKRGDAVKRARTLDANPAPSYACCGTGALTCASLSPRSAPKPTPSPR